MSAQPPTTPRIEDLRARLRLDPKARHFYPLAEELRKLGRLDEAETILRDGIVHHPTYLSAWMSLGRILAEKGAHRDAVEALTRALALDPGNVVCANLLATSYLALGERVEALKKLKLVRAVMPGDEVDEQIAAIEKDIAAAAERPAGFAPQPAAEAVQAAPAPLDAPGPQAGAEAAPPPPSAAEATPEVREAATAPEPAPAPPLGEAVAGSPLRHEAAAKPPASSDTATEAPSWEPPGARPFLTEPEEEPAAAPPLPPDAADVLPAAVFSAPAAEESSFDESLPEESLPEGAAPPGPSASMPETRDDAIPEGAPLFGLASPEPFPADEAAQPSSEESFASEVEEPPAAPAAIADDQTATLTMAELYAKQGHDAAARDIYERVLERDPANSDVRERLAALSRGAPSPEREQRLAAAARLERWLEKVGRRGL